MDSMKQAELIFLPLCLLFGSIGKNQSTLMALNPKDYPTIGKSIEVFFSIWFASHHSDDSQSLFLLSLSLFLTQFAFNQRSLTELTQCSLYFRHILSYYRNSSFSLLFVEEQKTTKKIHTEEGSHDVIPLSNCITSVISKKSVIPKSILNTFLVSLNDSLSACSSESVSTLHSVIDCIVETAVTQCSVGMKTFFEV